MLANLKMKLFKEDEAKDILNRIFLEPLQPQIEIINPLILKAKLLMKWGNFSEALLNFQQIMEIIQKQGNTIFSNLKEEYFQSDFVLLENPEMMKAEVMNRMSIC